MLYDSVTIKMTCVNSVVLFLQGLYLLYQHIEYMQR